VIGCRSRQQESGAGGFAQFDIGEGASITTNASLAAHRQQRLEQGKTLDPTAGVPYASINQIN
jgi:hypothetical protein